MAKDVKFNIKLRIDGKEAILQASANTRELAKELGIAADRGDEMLKRFQKIASISTALNNAMNGLQQLTGIMQQYTAANAVQVQAETKLETVMRQRMKATDDEIQSIKDLASAQQQLGVIGDEVQLAGAQQLATFLNQKQSIETLLPAMNNLLAQQKGLSATSEDAVQKANLMGKAMQGQVDSLKEVGITFTAAQAQIMKMGNEEQRAAMLAQIITDNVGQMNAALAQTDAGRAQQAANAYGDMKEQVGALFASIEPGLVAVAELGLALSSVATIGAGIKSVSTVFVQLIRNVKLSTVATTAHGVATKIAAAHTKLWQLQLKYANRAQIAWTFGAKAATAQAIAMRAAILGLYAVSGLGIAIAAVTTAISLFGQKADDSTKVMQENQKQANAMRAAYEQEEGAITQSRAALEVNIARLRDFNGTKDQERKLVEEMNTAYGDTMGYFATVAEWYKALTANSEAYCKQMIVEARTRSLANAIAQKEQENYNLVYDEKGQSRKYSRKREREQVLTGYGPGGYAVYEQGAEIAGTSDYDKAIKQYRDNLAEINAMKEQMKQAVDELNAISFSVTGKKQKPGTPDATKGKATPEPDVPIKTENLQNLKEYADAIAYYQQQQQTADLSEVKGIQEKIDKLKEERDAYLGITRAKVESVEDDTDNQWSGKLETLRDYNLALEHYIGLQQTANKAEYQDLQKTIDAIREKRDEFTGASNQIVQDNESAAESMGTLASAMGQLGGSIEGQAGQWLQWGANLLQAIAKAIPAIMSLTAAANAEANVNAKGAAAKAANSVAGIPFVGPAMAVAAIASVVAALASIPKFAKGGIAYGPTLGMFGEYPGASSNPEVVAPLDRLRSLIQPQYSGFSGEVEFKIKGRRLVGILQNENNRERRG
jgi:hypothetical protein